MDDFLIGPQIDELFWNDKFNFPWNDELYYSLMIDEDDDFEDDEVMWSLELN